MLLDLCLEFFSNKAITDDAFGDVWIPLGAEGSPVAADVAKGETLYAYARVGTAFATCDSIDIEIGYADDKAGTNFASLMKKTVLVAALTANKYIPLGAIPGGGSGKGLVCKVTVAGTNASAGTLTVGLTANKDGMPQNAVFTAA